MAVPSLGPVSSFDAVALVLLVHVLAIVVAILLVGDSRSRATSLWRYNDPRVAAVTLTLVALGSWAVVAAGRLRSWDGELAWTWPLLIGAVLASYALSNGLLFARVVAARRRPGPPADGDVVAVDGHARPVEGTTGTPFGDAEALCLQATVEAYESNPFGATGFVEHGEHVASRRFAVDDGDREVVVDPADARWRLPEIHRTTVDDGAPLPDHVAAGLGETPALDRPDGPHAGFSVEDRRFTERTLQPGRRVFVVGAASVDDEVVVDSGDPFVVTASDAELARAAMVAWTVGGGVLAAWLLAVGVRRLATAVGLA